MATLLDPTLTNKQFHNWLKGALALLFGKQGLTEFVDKEITDFQKNLLQSVFQKTGNNATCNACTTANVLSCPTKGFCGSGKRCYAHDNNVPSKKPNKRCPNGICQVIRDEIRNRHRYANPSWKNSDAHMWFSDAFQCAKCFLPPDGYSDKSSIDDTDFNGVISIVHNNKAFERKLTSQLNSEPNICSRAREAGRIIRHSANFLLSDVDLASCIDAILDLLRDPGYLLHDPQAQACVNKLIQLKNNNLLIQAEDITKILDEGIRQSFSKEQNDAIQAIQEHLCQVKSETISAVDTIIVTKMAAIYEIRQSAESERRLIEQQLGKQLQWKTNKDRLNGQEPFQTEYGYPVDVREGVFFTNMQASIENEEPLKMGCTIAKKITGEKRYIHGTLGGFIDHPQYGLCGLTCAHVLLDDIEMIYLEDEGELSRLDFTSDSASVYLYKGNDNYIKIGRLVKAILTKGDTGTHGMDAAIFQIKRNFPVAGVFVNATTQDEDPVHFDSGKAYNPSRFPEDLKVFKYGSATGKTTGQFLNSLPIITVKIQADKFPVNLVMYNQIEIKGIDNTMFSDKGDSGSLVMMEGHNGERFCIGIVEGITSYNTTVVTPIGQILEKLSVSSLKCFETDIMRESISRLDARLERVEQTLNERLSAVSNRWQCVIQ